MDVAVHHPTVSLFVVLGVTLAAARACGEIARRIGQPVVLGEILAGVLLGPTVFGALVPEAMPLMAPQSGLAAQFLSGFYAVSVALFLLGAGMEVNLSSIVSQGKAAVSISVMGFIIPFGLGLAAGWIQPRLFGAEAE